MRAVLTVMDHALALECAEHERKRLEDLADALNQRLQSWSGEADAVRRLILTALALLDETQAAGAALARAHTEVDRLTDLLVDARLDALSTPDSSERGRVGALRRVAEGAA